MLLIDDKFIQLYFSCNNDLIVNADKGCVISMRSNARKMSSLQQWTVKSVNDVTA